MLHLLVDLYKVFGSELISDKCGCVCCVPLVTMDNFISDPQFNLHEF